MPILLKKIAFALANTAAALTALYIAFARDLERPYWAVFTVFIVANPISGAVRSKGVFRFLGTFAGVAISLLLIPPLVQEPVLLCLAISLWVGLCLYLSLLDRTPRSYAFLLAGYTATIVGLAVVDAPERIFDTSMSRLEEISLGIVCAAIAHSVFFPQNVLEELNEKIGATIERFSLWLAGAVTRSERAEDVETQEQLAGVVTELHVLYTQVAFETSDVPRADRVMQMLQDRLTALLPALTAVQRAFTALVEQGSVRAPIAAALEGVARWARWVAEATHRPSHGLMLDSSLRAELAAASAQSRAGESLDWRGLLENSLVIHLKELIVALEDCQFLAAALKDPRTKLPSRLEREALLPGRRILYRDRGLAFLSACAAVGGTLIACVLWIEGSWPEGAVAAQFAAIGCSLFATLDNPAKVIRAAVVGILVALPFAALYEFAIFPQIDGFASLALVLSPAVLLFSLMQASEKLEGAGLVIAIGFFGGLALQSSYSPNFSGFVNSSTAEVVGLLVAAATNLIFRTIDPAWNALRISKAGWRSVSRLAAGWDIDSRRWAMGMFDRVGLVTSRLRDGERVARLARWDLDGLRDLRVGLNVAVIRSVERQLGSPSGPVLEEALGAVSRMYRSRLHGRLEEKDVERAIDRGITTLGEAPPTREVLDGLAALTSLRLDLTPMGSEYRTPLPAA
jgi:uncharacterized membrane protein YccC